MTDWAAAYALGATLYMPIVHPRASDIVLGHQAPPASSLVLCLEDALAEDDVQRGLATLRRLLPRIPAEVARRLYVRPRSLTMAAEMLAYPGADALAGFVAPKVQADTAPDWLGLAQQTGLRTMPTLESAEFFDPARIAAMRDVFSDHGPEYLAAIRLGGNDLLGALALRRTRGVSSWEGPLAWVMAMASSMLIAAGFPVAAPVFDIIDDIETLQREVQRDIAAGLVSKTAIHPAQVPVIESAMRVPQDDVARAEAIIADDARAVFQIGGAMCEPSTHRA
ncbi:MAG: HpcH/HpaI aldolase/citrate lyase family protein, partial [Pseudomonadota bacterium]